MIDIPPVKSEIAVYGGAYFYKEFVVLDVDGDPVDLTGWSGVGTAATFQGGEPMGTMLVSLVDPTEGVISVELDESATSQMEVGHYEVLMFSADATPRIHAVRYGPLNFIAAAVQPII
jgi:hypothetical protein